MASREEDKAIAGLLRRSLAQDAGPGDVCPTPDLLAAYYQHSLGGEERARQELHFSHCARCREQLAAMTRVQEIEKAGTEWAWRWDWRWLAPAAAALALVTIWVTRRAAPIVAPEGSRNAPLVAMSEPARKSAPEKTVAPPTSAAVTAPEEKAPTAARQTKPSEKPSEQPSVTGNKQVASGTALAQRGGVILPDNENGTSTRAALPAAPLAAVKAAPVSPPAARPAPVPPAPAEGSNASGESAVSADEIATGNPEEPPVAQMATREKGKMMGKLSALTKTAEDRSRVTLISTPDAAVLWRIAGAGFVERSDNNGATWQGQLVDPQGRLVAGSAPTTKVCWMVGSGGAIFLTEDGKKWKEIAPPEKSDFVAIIARDASSATVTAADGRKFSTTNAGRSWAPENGTPGKP